nr:endogenous retrovirus group K member 10 Gag polyprotein-like [Caretta caretta]XP_048703600.1 endogenous retrovirus group K member 10 Gag polyprotein-like [Caretta caretta]XP_048703601.1 endogenous retrovirus group K member 10 Gag polyprotein-like [Caretta caretta]XP_048703602.1 endogenous retrovirus group K member 10 Gag polyprotein-like [Caretta caretta]XP_048703604.1 endogenous retrovirus group K member 10 Gag polyprotein-like [Caretta caretta]XP_048703605.1 endogenous retrovirus group K 
MGSSLSALQVQHRSELQYLLRKAQHDCPTRELTLLLQEVRAQCPWYPEAGTLKLADWERLGQTLHKEPRAPVQALHAWHLCSDAILRVASDRPALARLVISPRLSAPAAIPPPGDATQRVASERPSPAPTEGLPIPPPPSAPATIPPPASPPVPLLPPPPWPSPPELVCDHHPTVVPHVPGPPGGSSASAQWLSLVQQMVHAAKTRSDITAEELADLVSVCSVTWQDDGQGNQVANWVSLPYSVIRDVKKAIREFGLTSTYVSGLIEGLGTGYTLIPEDWKALLRMMLTPSQYVIWLSEYRQMAERQAQVYREQGIIYEQLAGEGQFATVQMQSQLPQAVFPIISTCAQHAFQKVPDSGKPTKSFASICQGASESFMDFTNRLQEAILQQVDNPAAAQEILLKLAVENANEDCCRGLQAAQATGILELSDMLRACQNIGTQAHKAGVLAAALRKSGKEGKRCYRCGKEGHFQRECRSSTAPARPSKKCPKCRKGYHWANQCRSGSGNCTAGPPRTQGQTGVFPTQTTVPLL